jgi:GH43 family beta-xylosidase
MLTRKFTLAFVVSMSVVLLSFLSFAQTINVSDLYVRDPYIIADKKSGEYILYKASPVKNGKGETVNGVVAHKSKDLKTWGQPVTVYTTPDNNWAKGPVWAPEVHQYKGKYYLFATLNSSVIWKKKEEGWPDYSFRGTQIFHSQSPLGPFLPFSQFPHTAMDEMALDGTLWEEDGIPYMIYCHEWVQITDGTMKIVRLKPDLSGPAADPIKLFNASSAKWSTGTKHDDGRTSYVTDGCFLHKSKSGKLMMIWSSFKNGQYAIGVATSFTGSVFGPWEQQVNPIFEKHGGHGMLFKSFDNRLMLSFHGPNSPGGKERAQFFEIEDNGETLVLKGKVE